jgi:hypothetical protein
VSICHLLLFLASLILENVEHLPGSCGIYMPYTLIVSWLTSCNGCRMIRNIYPVSCAASCISSLGPIEGLFWHMGS